MVMLQPCVQSWYSQDAGMTLDQEVLRRKNEELSMVYKEKSRKLLQTQELYDKLKRRAMLGHIQDAALDAVDTTLHGGKAMIPQPMDHADNQGNYERQFGTPYGAPGYAHDTDRVDQTAAMPAQHRTNPQNLQNPAWARLAPPRGTFMHMPRDLSGFV